MARVVVAAVVVVIVKVAERSGASIL